MSEEKIEKKKSSHIMISGFGKTLIGLLITIIFMSVFGFQSIDFLGISSSQGGFLNGFSSAISFIFLSLICTGGISLGLWIPLWYGMGKVVEWVVDSYYRSRMTDEEKQNFSKNEKAVANFIKEARNNNFKDEAISSLLKLNGWSDLDIKNGFEDTKKSEDH